MLCTAANTYMIVALISFFVNIIYSSKLEDEEGFLRMFCGVLCICLGIIAMVRAIAQKS